ncbi:MAG: hypothetical protein IKT14_00640, partial [Clostridiales bacterium]|nr:hypothetical protein [Clostridiales bacterium]
VTQTDEGVYTFGDGVYFYVTTSIATKVATTFSENGEKWSRTTYFSTYYFLNSEKPGSLKGTDHY